ncbi:L,D-transpeptidase family protein [Chelativorans sp. YIM 93263]|uniref:L,D-transpeptidase family protein n=1 Tax=Chelativorans sp. YIM 93263 TaxID=2906648 RepID=UPI002377EF59|nr:murein L,D-transpeptidase family protein [Chelativorans sp. YIM 93263]
MNIRLAHAALLTAMLALAGCNGTLNDIAPKAERELPTRIVQTMKAKGMAKDAPIMMRIFKEEGELEVWKQKHNGRYDLVTSYDICTWSGKLGPKFAEGDRQAPEGFYTIRPSQMNPQSSYHLAFNIGFPNTFDRANGRTGKHLMVHGACSSSGCYSMTDEQVEEIYAFARDAFRGGQQAFQLQAFPFRMTAKNMARYRNDLNFEFWQTLKEGYDHFEVTRKPPKVDVCERRYVFNRIPAEGHSFAPTEACPPSSQPEALMTAYRAHVEKEKSVFDKALKSGPTKEAKPSIQGLKEAHLVADWSQRRARGENVTPQPPSLAPTAVANNNESAPMSVPVSAYAAQDGQTEGTAAPPPSQNSPSASGAESEDGSGNRVWNPLSRFRR